MANSLLSADQKSIIISYQSSLEAGDTALRAAVQQLEAPRTWAPFDLTVADRVHIAAHYGLEELIEHFIAKDASLATRKLEVIEGPDTPLAVAAAAGQRGVLSLLLNQKVPGSKMLDAAQSTILNRRWDCAIAILQKARATLSPENFHIFVQNFFQRLLLCNPSEEVVADFGRKVITSWPLYLALRSRLSSYPGVLKERSDALDWNELNKNRPLQMQFLGKFEGVIDLDKFCSLEMFPDRAQYLLDNASETLTQYGENPQRKQRKNFALFCQKAFSAGATLYAPTLVKLHAIYSDDRELFETKILSPLIAQNSLELSIKKGEESKHLHRRLVEVCTTILPSIQDQTIAGEFYEFLKERQVKNNPMGNQFLKRCVWQNTSFAAYLIENNIAKRQPTDIDFIAIFKSKCEKSLAIFCQETTAADLNNFFITALSREKYSSPFFVKAFEILNQHGKLDLDTFAAMLTKNILSDRKPDTLLIEKCDDLCLLLLKNPGCNLAKRCKNGYSRRAIVVAYLLGKASLENLAQNELKEVWNEMEEDDLPFFANVLRVREHLTHHRFSISRYFSMMKECGASLFYTHNALERGCLLGEIAKRLGTPYYVLDAYHVQELIGAISTEADALKRQRLTLECLCLHPKLPLEQRRSAIKALREHDSPLVQQLGNTIAAFHCIQNYANTDEVGDFASINWDGTLSTTTKCAWQTVIDGNATPLLERITELPNFFRPRKEGPSPGFYILQNRPNWSKVTLERMTPDERAHCFTETNRRGENPFHLLAKASPLILREALLILSDEGPFPTLNKQDERGNTPVMTYLKDNQSPQDINSQWFAVRSDLTIANNLGDVPIWYMTHFDLTSWPAELTLKLKKEAEETLSDLLDESDLSAITALRQKEGAESAIAEKIRTICEETGYNPYLIFNLVKTLDRHPLGLDFMTLMSLESLLTNEERLAYTAQLFPRVQKEPLGFPLNRQHINGIKETIEKIPDDKTMDVQKALFELYDELYPEDEVAYRKQLVDFITRMIDNTAHLGAPADLQERIRFYGVQKKLLRQCILLWQNNKETAKVHLPHLAEASKNCATRPMTELINMRNQLVSGGKEETSPKEALHWELFFERMRLPHRIFISSNVHDIAEAQFQFAEQLGFPDAEKDHILPPARQEFIVTQAGQQIAHLYNPERLIEKYRTMPNLETPFGKLVQAKYGDEFRRAYCENGLSLHPLAVLEILVENEIIAPLPQKEVAAARLQAKAEQDHLLAPPAAAAAAAAAPSRKRSAEEEAEGDPSKRRATSPPPLELGDDFFAAINDPFGRQNMQEDGH